MNGIEGIVYATVMVAVVAGFFIVAAITEWGQKWLFGKKQHSHSPINYQLSEKKVAESFCSSKAFRNFARAMQACASLPEALQTRHNP